MVIHYVSNIFRFCSCFFGQVCKNLFAIGWYLTFVVSLHLGGYPSVNNRALSPSLFGVKVSFNVAALVTDKFVIVIIFFCKNACNAIMHPGSYVIKARIKHEQIRVVELRGMLQNKAGSMRKLSGLRRLRSSRNYLSVRTSLVMSVFRFRQRYLNTAVVAPDPVSLSV
jgi:hypothetical protein